MEQEKGNYNTCCRYIGCCVRIGETCPYVQRSGETFGWSELFIGVIIVAIVGNAAEHASAVIMAYKNKMDVAVEIAVGSTLQVAMFVAPVLVLISLMYPTHMPLVFTLPELISMVTAVFLMIMISNDGGNELV